MSRTAHYSKHPATDLEFVGVDLGNRPGFDHIIVVETEEFLRQTLAANTLPGRLKRLGHRMISLFDRHPPTGNV